MEGNGGVDQLVDAIPQTQPSQTSGRQDQAVVLTSIKFLQAGDYVAAHILKAEVREVVAQLG